MGNTYKQIVFYLLLYVVVALMTCVILTKREPIDCSFECPAYTLDFCERYCGSLGVGFSMKSFTNGTCVCMKGMEGVNKNG